jgi:hypothetical protein
MVVSDFYYFIVSYLFVIIGGFFLINWLSNGVVRRFLIVKASRGSKILVKVHNKLKTYCVSGWLEGNDLLFFDNESKRNKQKTPKRIVVNDDVFYRFMGVWACDVDEATNNVFKHDGSVIPGFDVIRWNNLYLRALMKPATEDKSNIILFIIIGLVFIALIVSVVVLVKLGQVQQAVSSLGAIKSSSVGGVNVV